jgi:hypothetical protein
VQTSKLAKYTLAYLPVLAVLVATVLGMILGEGLYPTSIDSHHKPVTQVAAASDNPQPLNVLGTPGTCMGGLIFTSLPPKCKTVDGSFILANGASSYVILSPGGK